MTDKKDDDIDNDTTMDVAEFMDMQARETYRQFKSMIKQSALASSPSHIYHDGVLQGVRLMYQLYTGDDIEAVIEQEDASNNETKSDGKEANVSNNLH